MYHEVALSEIYTFHFGIWHVFILHIVFCIILSISPPTALLPRSRACIRVYCRMYYKLYAWGKWIEWFLSIIDLYKYIAQVMCHFTGKLLLLLLFHSNRCESYFTFVWFCEIQIWIWVWDADIMLITDREGEFYWIQFVQTKKIRRITLHFSFSKLN